MPAAFTAAEVAADTPASVNSAACLAALFQYRFLLPGAHIRGYRSDAGIPLHILRERYPLLIVQQPLNAADCHDCKILGERLELRGRQSDDEIRAMLRGDVARYLFLRERLIDNR